MQIDQWLARAAANKAQLAAVDLDGLCEECHLFPPSRSVSEKR
jgi:hypothetical protein